jgi:hypothetical protein
MNTSDFAWGIVFSQLGKDNFFHPIGFHFLKFFPTKINYEIDDKEFLIIVHAFEKRHHLLKGA